MDSETIIVNDKELAEYLGISDRRVRQLAKAEEGQDPVCVRVGSGNKFDLKRSVKNYIKFKDEVSDKLDLAVKSERLKHERLKQRKTQLEVEQMEKKLHKASDVERLWNSIVYGAKTKLLAIPTKIAPQLVAIEDQKEIQVTLRKEIKQALDDITNYDIDQFESVVDLGSGGEDDE